MAAVFHEEAGRLTAALVKRLGDFDLAEECVQDALVAALEHWPREGIPNNPGAWLITTARRKGIDWQHNDAHIKPGDPYPYQNATNPFAKLLALKEQLQGNKEGQ